MFVFFTSGEKVNDVRRYRDFSYRWTSNPITRQPGYALTVFQLRGWSGVFGHPYRFVYCLAVEKRWKPCQC
jgi:hypothetical protein